MQIPEGCENWNKAQWIAHIRKKTTGVFMFGLFLGMAITIGFVSIAYIWG